jgi:hypothetical protein
MDLSGCSIEELWRFVAAHLERRGIGVVLVGGAVVSIYTEGAYLSGDLDFVPEDLLPEGTAEAMDEIGFRREGRHFRHPDCSHLFVEFVSGPLGIGEDARIEPARVAEGECQLKLLSPTDSVRDRLSGFIHFGQREYMDQAILVASARPVDWDVIEGWSRGEGPRGPEAFEELRRRVAGGT